MAKILINDGIHNTGLEMLKSVGFEVITETIAQDQLSEKLPEYDAICVQVPQK